MVKQSSVSKQEFEQLLEEQKGPSILKWSELEENGIYEITNFEIMETRVGKSGVITISDDARVWSCSTLTKRLENLDLDFGESVALVRPTGKTESKTTGNMYNSFELVVICGSNRHRCCSDDVIAYDSDSD